MGRNDELMAEIRQLVQPWLDELRRTLFTSMGVNERGAHRVSVPNVAATATNGVKASTVANSLKGFSFRETAGSASTPAAVVELLDGTDSSAEVVATISLAANESVRDWFSEKGIALVNGLYVNRVSGQVSGAVYLGGGGAT